MRLRIHYVRLVDSRLGLLAVFLAMACSGRDPVEPPVADPPLTADQLPFDELFYGRSPAEHTRIWRARSDGSDRRRWLPDDVAQTCPRLSPDRRLLAFHIDASDGRRRIRIAKIDASDQHDVVNKAYPYPGKGGSTFPSCPVWAADGSHIAWQEPENATAIREIWMARADGSAQQRLISEDPRGASPIFWLSDGSGVAYTVTDELHILRLDGTVSTSDLGRRWFLTSVSASGKIAGYCTSSRADFDWHLCIADADGSNARVLIALPDTRPSLLWSPDETLVAFVRDGNVFTIRSDGTSERKHTDLSYAADDLNWSPRSNAIAFSSQGGLWRVMLGGAVNAISFEYPGWSGTAAWSFER